MTNRTAWPTSISGDLWTGANFNLYGRDNDLAYWVYQAAGDLAYASSASALARVAIGASGKVLTSNGSVPSWGTLALGGMFHTKGSVEFSPDASYGLPWADIAGATLTLTLTKTCSILVWAEIAGYVDGSTGTLQLRAVVNGVADAGAPLGGNNAASVLRVEEQGYIYLATGVTAGSRVVKLQASGTSNGPHITEGRLFAMAVTE